MVSISTQEEVGRSFSKRFGESCPTRRCSGRGSAPPLNAKTFDRYESMTVRRRLLGMAWEDNSNEARGGAHGEIR